MDYEGDDNINNDNNKTKPKEMIEKIEHDIDKLEMMTELLKHLSNNILQERMPELKKQTEELKKYVQEAA